MQRPLVAIVKGERSTETVRKAIRLIGGLYEFSDRPVLLKVNFITDKRWDTGATTDPIVVEAIIQELKPINPRIYVVESDATLTNADEAAKKTGIMDVCRTAKVPFINLRRERERVSLQVEPHEVLSTITLSKIVLESRVVSLAKLKTHAETKVTLGLKNMFGLLPDKLKFKYHLKDIEKVVVDIASVKRPDLTVIDGFVAMEGRGPVSGKPVRMDLIIAGKDVVATDATAARIMGFDPHDVFHIRRVAEKGLGRIDDVEVVGESVEAVARPFERG